MLSAVSRASASWFRNQRAAAERARVSTLESAQHGGQPGQQRAALQPSLSFSALHKCCLTICWILGHVWRVRQVEVWEHLGTRGLWVLWADNTVP